MTSHSLNFKGRERKADFTSVLRKCFYLFRVRACFLSVMKVLLLTRVKRKVLKRRGGEQIRQPWSHRDSPLEMEKCSFSWPPHPHPQGSSRQRSSYQGHPWEPSPQARVGVFRKGLQGAWWVEEGGQEERKQRGSNKGMMGLISGSKGPWASRYHGDSQAAGGR